VDIKGFAGRYRYLSNFYYTPVLYEGIMFTTAEHAYQAAKSLSFNERGKVASLATPVEAKRYGGAIQLRPEWDLLKYGIMYTIVHQKFSNATLLRWLLATGDAYLEETNTWGDTYWGVCNGIGANNLGRILMDVRDWYRNPS
jgi:N-glycosidase YbiA